MPVATMRELLEAGIHFGHQTRRWNPKMARYIFGQRNNLYIIDLQKTLKQMRAAYSVVRDTVARGGTVLFVGTKKQAQEPIQREAERCGMFYVNNRWLGGTLTNFETMRRSIKNLIHMEEMETNGALERMKKKEIVMMRKERARMDKNLAGIKHMERIPNIMFVIDTRKENIAIREANRLGITAVGVVDTNCDPDVVDIPVPGNDDAIRAVNLYCTMLADAVLEGKALQEKRQAEELRKQDEAKRQKLARAKAIAAAQESGEGEAAAEPVPAAPAADSAPESAAEAEEAAQKAE